MRQRRTIATAFFLGLGVAFGCFSDSGEGDDSGGGTDQPTTSTSTSATAGVTGDPTTTTTGETGTTGSGVCGDGARQGTEECDDGNDDDYDACSTACRAAVEPVWIQRFKLSGNDQPETANRAAVIGTTILVPAESESIGVGSEGLLLRLGLQLGLEIERHGFITGLGNDGLLSASLTTGGNRAWLAGFDGSVPGTSIPAVFVIEENGVIRNQLDFGMPAAGMRRRAREVAAQGDGAFVVGFNDGTAMTSTTRIVGYDGMGVEDWEYVPYTIRDAVVKSVRADDDGNILACGERDPNVAEAVAWAATVDADGSNDNRLEADEFPGATGESACDLRPSGDRWFWAFSAEGVGLTRQLFVSARDVGGNEAWRFEGRPDRSERAKDVRATPDGGVLVVVEARAGINDVADILVIKLDEQGSLEWTSSYDGPTSGDDIPTGIAIEPMGPSAIVTGSSPTSATGTELVVLRLCASGC